MAIDQAFNLLTATVPVSAEVTPAQLIGPYMTVFFIAFVACFALTPVVRAIALRIGVIDKPDYDRKAHAEPIAYLGGVAIFLAWCTALLATWFVMDFATLNFRGIAGEGMSGSINYATLFSIIGGGAIITLTGLVDDITGLSPRVKVGGQLIGTAVLAYNNVATGLAADMFALLGFNQVPQEISYIMATCFMAMLVIGACNAMNLLDGLDGLAAGIATIAMLGFLSIATYTALHLINDPQATAWSTNVFPLIIVITLAMIGALLGFLPYNFNPANIFMGDAGSLLLGYVCAATVLLFANVPDISVHTPSRGPLLVMAALIVFGVPICDTSLAIFRRKMRGQPIFSPDSQHIHHLLVRSGLNVKKAVFIMYVFGVMCALIGFSLAMVNIGRFVLAVFLVIFSFIMATAYKYGHLHALHEAKGNGRSAHGQTHSKIAEQPAENPVATAQSVPDPLIDAKSEPAYPSDELPSALDNPATPLSPIASSK